MPAAEAGSRFDRRARGAQVELAAREHLVAAGLRFVAANVNFRCGELDLVMQDRDRMGELLVFVEVRYREGGNNSGFGGGADSVDGWKRRKLMQAAQLYLLKQHSPEAPCRFDVVEASGDPCRPELHWIRDAFRADD